MEVEELQKAMQGMMQYGNNYRGAELTGHAQGFDQHVKNLRGTMFYVCQGSCLCGTVNNRGKVIYCYGDLVPRHGELFSENGDSSSRTTPRDLLAAQLGIWVFGLIALLIVLLLIRKSISSLREHIEKVTAQLPWYHDDDDVMSNHSTTSPPIQHKDTTMESMDGMTPMESDLDCALTPEHMDGALTPLNLNIHRGPQALSKSGVPTSQLAKTRLKGKDYKKGGDGLRGKNVTEAFRVKEKDMKRTMK